MPVATLLNAVSANTTGPVVGLGTPTGTLTVSVTTSGTVSGLSVVVQGSNDSVNWENIGSAITSVTAGTSVGTGVLFQYFQALLSGYSGTGTVTCHLAYSLGGSGGGPAPPNGAAGGVLTGTYPNPGITTLNQSTTGTAAGLSTTLAIGSGGTGSQTQNFTGLRTPSAVVTTSGSPYAASAGEYVRTDTTGGNVTVNLPSAPPANTVIGVKQVAVTSPNTTTYACTGSDVFNVALGATSGTLTLLSQGVTMQYNAGIWLVQAGDLPLSQTDLRYAALAGATFTGEVTVPTPLNSGDAATKAYADTVATGLSVRLQVAAATTAVLSPANTYNNGTLGVGAYLQASGNGVLTVDGHAVVLNDRILVKNEAAAGEQRHLLVHHRRRRRCRLHPDPRDGHGHLHAGAGIVHAGDRRHYEHQLRVRRRRRRPVHDGYHGDQLGEVLRHRRAVRPVRYRHGLLHVDQECPARRPLT